MAMVFCNVLIALVQGTRCNSELAIGVTFSLSNALTHCSALSQIDVRL